MVRYAYLLLPDVFLQVERSICRERPYLLPPFRSSSYWSIAIAVPHLHFSSGDGIHRQNIRRLT